MQTCLVVVTSLFGRVLCHLFGGATGASEFDRGSVEKQKFLVVARLCHRSSLQPLLAQPCALSLSCAVVVTCDLTDGRSVVFSDTPRNCGAVLMGVSCAGLSCDFNEVAGEIHT